MSNHLIVFTGLEVHRPADPESQEMNSVDTETQEIFDQGTTNYLYYA